MAKEPISIKELESAVFFDDFAAIKKYFKKGHHSETKQKIKSNTFLWTAIMGSLQQDNLKTIDLLLKHEMDIYGEGSTGERSKPVHLLMLFFPFGVVWRFLLKDTAIFDMPAFTKLQDKAGQTPADYITSDKSKSRLLQNLKQACIKYKENLHHADKSINIIKVAQYQQRAGDILYSNVLEKLYEESQTHPHISFYVEEVMGHYAQVLVLYDSIQWKKIADDNSAEQFYQYRQECLQFCNRTERFMSMYRYSEEKMYLPVIKRIQGQLIEVKGALSVLSSGSAQERKLLGSWQPMKLSDSIEQSSAVQFFRQTTPPSKQTETEYLLNDGVSTKSEGLRHRFKK